MKRKMFFCVPVWLLGILAALPIPAFSTPWTPVEWQDNGKLRNWIRDANGNFVDDLIEAQTGQVSIIVDLNGCIGDPSTASIVQYLNTVGDVTYVGKYLSIINVAGVDVNDTYAIASRPEVAMVELELEGEWLTPDDNYRAAKVAHSNDYHPAGSPAQELEHAFNWPTTLNGNGVNIAFLDCGVDNASYTAVNGYDATTKTPGDPSSACPHATWMADWVFGPGGMAPSAGLIDIKVGTSKPDWNATVHALDKVFDLHKLWNINVVCMMFSWRFKPPALTDGKDAAAQIVDMLTGKGIVVVAAAGSWQDPTTGALLYDEPVGTPAAASRAIAVSCADINGTVHRANDTAPFVKGPRDGTFNLDAHKPELVFPTGEVHTGGAKALGTSMASAMTSGLVALVLQHNADLRNFDNKAAGSVKDLLIRTAEPKGTPDTTVNYPGSTPTWDNHWGFGEIDAYEAFHHLSGQDPEGRTDLTFKGFDGSAHPSPSVPWYYSPAVETQSERDKKNIIGGVADKVFARLYNAGPKDAKSVRVSFGFYPFTAGIPKFYDIGSLVTDIANKTTKDVSINWTPPILPPGDDHGCILVTIDYGYDSKFSNGSNFAQKNVRVEGTSSPATFNFRVENTLATEATILLEVINQIHGWDILLSDYQFAMEEYECARVVQATVSPTVPHALGTEALYFVTAYAAPWGTEDFVEIGGVALKARYEGHKELVGVDIGGSRPPGSIVSWPPDLGDLSITAGGADIWGTRDQFYYAFAIDPNTGEPDYVSGDFTAIVGVRSMEPNETAHEWAKAGIMARQDVEPGSPHTMVIRSLKNGVALQGRDIPNQESWSIPMGDDYGPDQMVWLRLDRVGNTFTGSYFVGGETPPTMWTASSSFEIPLPTDVLLGLATTSHEQGTAITVEYSDFGVGSYAGPVLLLDP